MPTFAPFSPAVTFERRMSEFWELTSSRFGNFDLNFKSLQRPSTARHYAALNASWKINRLSLSPPTSPVFAESMAGSISRWSDIVVRTNRNPTLRNLGPLQFWDAISHGIRMRTMPQTWREGSSSRARVPSFTDPAQVCSIWGGCRNAVWDTFGKCKFFFSQKKKRP